MATNTIGTRHDVASRTKPEQERRFAKHHKILTVSGSQITHFTGSAKGTSGFIIQTADTGKIFPTHGDAIPASILNTKELYEIGVSQISGSGVFHLTY